MRRMLWLLSITALCASCAQLPPSPADIQAKRFETVPDKAVIYVVRQPMDSHEPGGLLFDTGEQVTTFNGTYYRFEVVPGVRRIMGMSPTHATLTLDTRPGEIYFVRHTVFGTPRMGAFFAALTPIPPQEGRNLVAHSELVR